MIIKDLMEHIKTKKSADKNISIAKLVRFQGEKSSHNENEVEFIAEEYGSYMDDNSNNDYPLYNQNEAIDKDKNPFYGSGIRKKLPFLIDSNCFQELVELKTSNENCSYVSCVDELLESGYVPKKIPAILMGCDLKRVDERAKEGKVYSITAEKFGSKMLNFFEIPTMFCENLTFKGENQDQQYVATVDFIKYGEIMMSVNEYLADYVYAGEEFRISSRTIEDVVALNEQVIRFHYKNVEEQFGLPENFDLEREVSKSNEEVAYRHFIRRYSLGDGDSVARNVGKIVNKKTHMMSSSSEFDLEDVAHFDKNFFPEGFANMFERAQKQGIEMEKLMVLYFDYQVSDYVSNNFIKDVETMSKKYTNALNKYIKKSNELLEKDENGISKLDDFLEILEEGVVEPARETDNNNDLQNNEQKSISQIFASNFKFVNAVCEYYAEKNDVMEC